MFIALYLLKKSFSCKKLIFLGERITTRKQGFGKFYASVPRRHDIIRDYCTHEGNNTNLIKKERKHCLVSSFSVFNKIKLIIYFK